MALNSDRISYDIGGQWRAGTGTMTLYNGNGGAVLADVVLYRSPDDGAIVVQVDTQADTGRVRVNINDGEVFDRDPESPAPGLSLAEANELHELIGAAIEAGDVAGLTRARELAAVLVSDLTPADD